MVNNMLEIIRQANINNLEYILNTVIWIVAIIIIILVGIILFRGGNRN